MSGVVTSEDLQAAHRAACFVLPEDGPTYILFDLTGVTELRLAPREVRETPIAHSERGPSRRRSCEVVVAPQLPLFFRARRWWRKDESVPSVVVPSRTAAESWIASRQRSPA